MSVQVSYKKQSIFSIFLALTIILILEISAYIILEINDSCIQSLPKSNLYENFDAEKLKQICNDYKSTIHYVLPFNHFPENQQSKTVNINSDGFRGAEINDVAKSYKIFMTGGSTAYGIYASSDEKTIPAELEKLFLKSGLNVDVINAGVSGATVNDEFLLIQNKIIKFQPDLIISYTGWNDLVMEYSEKNNEYTDEMKISNNLLFVQKYTKIDDLQAYLWRVIEKRTSSNENEALFSTSLENKHHNWKKQLNQICNLGKEENFKTIVALQPLLGTSSKQLSTWEVEISKKLKQEEVIEQYQDFSKNLIELDESCEKTINLTKIFNNVEGTIFQDSGHVGDRGNNIIANKIFEQIFETVKEDIK
tara:strand:+ start:625 stop:1716 length:1092 start_codon:yes stop_codon:yes gene_type:complete